MKKSKGRFYRIYTIEKSLRHHVIEWVATFLSVSGAIINSQAYIEGFFVFAIGNILWLFFSAKHRHWGLLVMHAAYLIINFFALYTWYTNGLGKSLFW